MSGPRAYDLFLAAHGIIDIEPDAVPAMKSEVAKSVRFIVTPAAACFDQTVRANGGEMEVGAIGRVVVPFERMWMEWEPTCGDTGVGGVTQRRYAAYCHYVDGRLYIAPFICCRAGARVAVMALARSFSLLVTNEGEILDPESAKFGLVYNEKERVHENCLGVVLFTLALLGAKNVGRHEERLPRAFRRHPGTFAATAGDAHWVLDIPGATEFQNGMAGAGSEAAQRRLHIVRGHFADYSEGGGLFGKLHGRYYIAPHVRGDASRGTVTKDYRVRPSTGEARA